MIPKSSFPLRGAVPQSQPLANPPIESTTVQIHFPEIPTMDDGHAARDLYERVRASFPLYVTGMAAHVDASGNHRNIPAATYTSIDGRDTVTLTPAWFSFNTSRKELGRIEIANIMRGLSAIVEQVVNPCYMLRIGLRHINRGPLEPYVDRAAYLAEHLVAPTAGLAGDFHMSSVISGQTDEGFTTIQYGTAAAGVTIAGGIVPPASHPVWYLDIDNSVSLHPTSDVNPDEIRFDPKKIELRLLGLGARANAIFQWAMSPAFLTSNAMVPLANH